MAAHNDVQKQDKGYCTGTSAEAGRHKVDKDKGYQKAREQQGTCEPDDLLE